MRSPTANTLRHLRAIGYDARVVERFNPHVGQHGIRQDLFGWMDVLAIRGDKDGCLGIQSTSRSNASSRLRKMIATPALRVWLKAGNRAELWTWAKVGSRWRLRRREVTVADLREPFKCVERKRIGRGTPNRSAPSLFADDLAGNSA